MDDYASNSLNERHSYRLGTKQSSSNFIKNIENIKNDEIPVVSDDYEKLLVGKNYHSVDMNNYDVRNNLSSRDKMIENEKLINYKKYFESNCETVFTKLGNIQNKNGNPENSLIHSRLFSSSGSPNSSVELFENEKTRDMKLNRNADCPDFLPNIVKELKCFQLSKIDEEIQIQDEKQKENFLLKSMNVLLNNLIDIEKEKEKEKEIEKEKGKISLILNENNLFLVNGKFIENNKNSNEENFLNPDFHNFGIKKNNNRKDIVNGNKHKMNESNNNNNSIFFSRGEREKDKEREEDNSQFEKELDEEKEKELTHVINKWSPF
jgi:hypothetical protein